MTQEPAPLPTAPRTLPRNVKLLGLASLLFVAVLARFLLRSEREA